MKKKLFLLLYLLSICVILCGCKPTDYLFLETKDKDLFFDLLIPFDSSDENYVDYYIASSDEEGDGVTSLIKRESEIVQYNEDGFCSMSFHYRGSVAYHQKHFSDSTVSVMFYSTRQTNGTTSKELSAFIEKYKMVKVAAYDKSGNIIHISNKIDLMSDQKFAYYTHLFYDSKTNQVNVRYDESYMNSRLIWGREPREWGVMLTYGCYLLLLFLIIQIAFLCFTKKNVKKWRTIISIIGLIYAAITSCFHVLLLFPQFSVSFIPNTHIGEIGSVILMIVSLINIYIIKRGRNSL